MNFPSWAPRRLIEDYERLVQDEAEFSDAQYPLEELTIHAQKNGFPSWEQLHVFLMDYRECLSRLLTDETMRSVWAWIGDEPTINQVWGDVSKCLESWAKASKLTKKEFDEERNEIADLAKKLAQKLAKHQGNITLSFRYAELIPDAYHESALKSLHPETMRRCNEKNQWPGFHIGQGLPPLHVLIEELGKKAKLAEYGTKPTKIHSNSAIRQLLLKRICWTLYGFGVEHSTPNLASFLYVILDDVSITDATIRGDLKASDWWVYLSSKDCAGMPI